MSTRTLETDYLVIGSGAAGMAFTDALIAASDAQVVMVDRRHAPGGHWQEAYPFVRLHQPSSYYGVNSLPLGAETIDRDGPNQGLYERASAPEICAYYQRAMERSLLPSGQVRYFPMCDVVGENRFVSRASGAEYEVKVRRKIVDARYLQPAVPASSAPPFEVAEDVRCVPLHELSRMAERADGYVIIGAGKTSIDACLWLLEIGVPPSDICWIKSREAWLVNRAFVQGGELVGRLFEGLSLQMEAAAQAGSLAELFDRLDATGQLLRVDESVTPTMYKAATVTTRELEQLRRIERVVRLGRVRRIDRDAITLEGGTIPTSSRQLHVHCAAAGLNPAPAVPMFATDRVTLQPIRSGLIPFNAALVGFVEATRSDSVDLAEMNRLCPTNLLPNVPLDWVRGTLVGMSADYQWSKAPDIVEWLERARLNPSRGLRHQIGQPQAQQASARYAEHVRPGLAKLRQFIAQAPT
jgi:hypothetical protein